MNPTNDFICTLINNREKFVEKLAQNYSYQYLHKIFTEINSEYDQTIKIIPDDKKLYRVLTGQFEASRYDKSSIDWIPSEELVDGIISIIKYFGIKHVEELYTGHGILASLLSKKDNTIEITTADTFDYINTCNKLGFTKIAKRSASDYKYYEQIKAPYPDMIISTHYPEIPFLVEASSFFGEIIELISSGNHKIIVLILPNTCTIFYNTLYYFVVSGKYKLYSYHIKALDKYFFTSDLMKNHYKSTMLAHILVRTDEFNQVQSLDEIFSSAIIPTQIIDMHCNLLKLLITFYSVLSPKLVKNIYRNYDIYKIFNSQKKIKELTQSIFQLKNINVPQYIYDIDELLFWEKCFQKNLFFVFDTRLQFYDFYITTISVKNSETRRNIQFPYWIQTLDEMSVYIYLNSIKTTEDNEWQISKSKFNSIFLAINNKNKKLLNKNKIN